MLVLDPNHIVASFWMDKNFFARSQVTLKLSQYDDNSNDQNQISARRLENMIVVGDRVNVLVNHATEPMILERLPRLNQLSRSTSSRAGGKLIEQVLASNVDQIITVFAAANPKPKWNLLDRYLVMAEAVELPVWIVITKTDLVEQSQEIDELNQQLAVYRKIGYPVLLTSCVQQNGIEGLRSLLKQKNSVLIGKSGVGKTSLLNALIPGLDYKVSNVNETTGKGRHTTSAMRLLPMDEDTTLIDSPGTREFGLWDVDPDDLDWCFKEMRPYLGFCKFKLDCQHEDEPGCAIRQAVVNGQINPRRYHSYLKLKGDILL